MARRATFRRSLFAFAIAWRGIDTVNYSSGMYYHSIAIAAASREAKVLLTVDVLLCLVFHVSYSAFLFFVPRSWHQSREKCVRFARA